MCSTCMQHMHLCVCVCVCSCRQVEPGCVHAWTLERSYKFSSVCLEHEVFQQRNKKEQNKHIFLSRTIFSRTALTRM